MNKKNLLKQKKRLLQELEDLSSGDDCNFFGLKDSDDNLPDLVDRANGDYAICERCGEDIAIKRLKANPVARHCIRCKTEIETRERLISV